MARCFALLLAFAAMAPLPALATPPARSVGASIYLDGILPGGGSAVGARVRLPALTGADAACVRCHRRSGLGAAEGPFAIPPIAKRFLAQAREESRLSADGPIAPGYHTGRGAFSDATLARAIREGLLPGGGVLNELMPRYELDDQAMASLIAYMKTLGRAPAPGVTAGTLHFATIVTPDADPVRREAMLDVLNHYFAAPNPLPGAPRRVLHENRVVGYRTGAHKWVLHVWQLSGRPDTWERQLHERLAAEPVFAIVSGLGGREWGPVHRFCEHEAIPCLLPNVELPIFASRDFYSIYFSGGVLLEADLGAQWLAGLSRSGTVQRVVQVYRRDDIGAAAAHALRAQLSATGVAVVDLALGPGAQPDEWRQAIAGTGSHDALVLWARRSELAGVASSAPPAGVVLVSGLMGGLSAAQLPAPWRERVRMTYPFGLPGPGARSAVPRAWLVKKGIPLADEGVQIDTYVACAALSDIVGSLFDSYSRELLIERFEDMLGTAAPPGRYPRLGLAQGQRFASKGGYIVRFSSQDAGQPIAEGDWIVP
jgi:cytochrome c553